MADKRISVYSKQEPYPNNGQKLGWIEPLKSGQWSAFRMPWTQSHLGLIRYGEGRVGFSSDVDARAWVMEIA